MIAQPHSAKRRKPRPVGHGATFAALSVCLLVAGCGARASGNTAPVRNDRPAPSAAADMLKKAMPTESDFPAGWQVQQQDTRPVALPGLNDADTAINTVVPDECQAFATGFVSAPGSSIPGDFVSSAIAMIPDDKGEFDQSSIVFFATKNTDDWGAPRGIQDSLRSCKEVTAQMFMQGQTMRTDFSSSPIDTSEIKSEAAGRTTVIRASDAQIRVAVVHATAKGLLISASSMVVSGSGDDQKALLVRLVAQTVDKLNALG